MFGRPLCEYKIIMTIILRVLHWYRQLILPIFGSLSAKMLYHICSITSGFGDMSYPNFHPFLIFSLQKVKQSSLFDSRKKMSDTSCLNSQSALNLNQFYFHST